MLSDGKNLFTLKTGNTPLDLTGWNLDKLVLTPPKGYKGNLDLQIRATSTEDSNLAGASGSAAAPGGDAPRGYGSSATLTRALAIKVLDGQPCATPVGINPYVSYLNQTAATHHGSPPKLTASPLRPEDRSHSIYVPGKPRHSEETEDSDEAMENWMKGLEHALNNAFMEEMGRVMRGET
jgi:hypothetical protein